jgi:uridine phosphorylase
MDKQHHIQLKRGDVGRYILLPGDPGRCDEIAEYLEHARLVSQNREFTSYTGMLLNEPVSVVSTGIGGASTAIAVEELVNLGADTFIRVGTCGGMSPDVRVNDIIIANAAIRFDGTSKEYIPVEFPAVADYGMLRVLDDAASELGISHHIGVVHCKDSFYGQHHPERMPLRNELLSKWQAWRDAGALASEMESSTLFILGSILRVRTGTVLSVAGNQVCDRLGISNPVYLGTRTAIEVAILALRKLIHLSYPDRVYMEDKS